MNNKRLNQVNEETEIEVAFTKKGYKNIFNCRIIML